MDQLIEVVEEFHRRGIIESEVRRQLLHNCFGAQEEAEVVLVLIGSFVDWLDLRQQPVAAEELRHVRTELEAVAHGDRQASLVATSRFVDRFAA